MKLALLDGKSPFRSIDTMLNDINRSARNDYVRTVGIPPRAITNLQPFRFLCGSESYK
jgi:hypothetical protein